MLETEEEMMIDDSVDQIAMMRQKIDDLKVPALRYTCITRWIIILVLLVVPVIIIIILINNFIDTLNIDLDVLETFSMLRFFNSVGPTIGMYHVYEVAGYAKSISYDSPITSYGNANSRIY